ncbi:MAG: 50S ribosomal protein L29 [Deltaproteobacteria bacterium]|nr:50S ribosomal protein L29 [Deltaproteobacteria bacterium]
MKIKQIRDLSIEELKQKERDLSKELFKLRFQFASGQLDSTASLTYTKKDIARIKTVIREREIAESR